MHIYIELYIYSIECFKQNERNKLMMMVAYWVRGPKNTSFIYNILITYILKKITQI